MRILFALLVASLLVAACAQEPAQPDTAASVEDIEADLAEIEDLEEELNLSDLDTLDEDLDFE